MKITIYILEIKNITSGKLNKRNFSRSLRVKSFHRKFPANVIYQFIGKQNSTKNFQCNWL